MVKEIAKLSEIVKELGPRVLGPLLQTRYAPPALLLDNSFVVLEVNGHVEPFLDGIRPKEGYHLRTHLKPDHYAVIERLAKSARIAGKVEATLLNWPLTAEAIKLDISKRVILITFPFDAHASSQVTEISRNTSTHSHFATGLIEIDERNRIAGFSASMRDFINIDLRDVGRSILDLNSPYLSRGLRDDIAVLTAGSQEVTRVIEEKNGRQVRRHMVKNAPGLAKGHTFVNFMDLSSETFFERERINLIQAQAELATNSALMIHSEDPTPVFENICNFLSRALISPRVATFIFDDEGTYARLAAGCGWPKGVVGQTRIRLDENSEISNCLSSNTPVIIDLTESDNCTPSQLAIDSHSKFCIATRIATAASIRGAIVLYFDHKTTLDDSRGALVTTMANVGALGIRKAEQTQEMAFQTRHMRDLIDGLPLQLGILDHNFNFVSINRPFESLGWTLMHDETITLSDVFGPDASTSIQEAFEAQSCENFSIEAKVQIPNEEDQVFLLHIARRRDGVVGFYLGALNIDDRKRAEELNKVISAELDHRVKNILALVSSIAFLTGQASDSIDEFLDALDQRISMLGRTHSLLVEQNWRGTTLQAIIVAELSPFEAMTSQKVKIDGEYVAVSAKATQSLALIIHELVTNAVKYGALSKNGGKLAITWKKNESDLILDWKESTTVKPPASSRVGFGSSVIQSIIVRQLGGTVKRALEDNGIGYVISLPLERLFEKKERS